MRLVIHILRPVIWVLCRAAFRVRFYGVENIPKKGPCLITPNHITYLDPIWITIPVSRRVHYMAWSKVFKIPGLGFLMRLFGAFPVNVDSTDTAAQRRAMNLVRNGQALVIFPEGGRTRTGEMMPFKLGAFRLALRYGVPIVPVTITGASEIWPAGRIFPRPGKLAITYHPPIHVEQVGDSISRSELKAMSRLVAQHTFEIVSGGRSENSVAPAASSER